MNTVIDQLLDKYLAGESSLEEERELKRLIMNSDDQDYAKWNAYFAEEDTLQNTRIPADDDAAMLEQFTEQSGAKIYRFSEMKKWMAIAASLLLFFLAGQWIQDYEQRQWKESLTEDSYESPEQAVEETKKAMAYFSHKYHKGIEISSSSMEETKYIDRYFNFKNQ